MSGRRAAGANGGAMSGNGATGESGATSGNGVAAEIVLPLVEVFETVEGEGTAAGYPTVFIRLFGCPLRCVWCDTPYSYAPHEPEMRLTVAEICARVGDFSSARVCLTGGEPLMFGWRSVALLNALVALPQLVDIHVETSGAIALEPFLDQVRSNKVRYIVDYKLPASGETHRMHLPNLRLLRPMDELKFVIADERDFRAAVDVLHTHKPGGAALFSPVFGRMPPQQLVERILAEGLANVRLNLQIHKVIWDPQQRGV